MEVYFITIFLWGDKMLEGFTEVLKVLVGKVSRKATIVALAMILIYMIAATPNVVNVVLFTISIVSLAVFFTGLQWILDIVNGKKTTNKKSAATTEEQDGKIISATEEQDETTT